MISTNESSRWEGSPSFRQYVVDDNIVGRVFTEGEGWTALWVDKDYFIHVVNKVFVEDKQYHLDQESAIDLVVRSAVNPIP
jgi:hypothetical protein